MFPGFALDDFDAFRPERASSNVYNRPRLAVKEKIVEIVHAAAELLRARCPDLEVGAADHVPNLRNERRVAAQWGYLWRPADERALVEEVLEGSRGVAELLADPPPHCRHGVLAAVIDTATFAVAVRVSARALLDAANLRTVLDDPSARARLLDAVHALPEPFAFVVPDSGPVPAAAVGERELEAFRAAFVDGSDVRFEIARSWPKAEAAAAGSGLLARAAADLAALEPVFAGTAWSRANDRIGFDALLERVRTERAHEEEEHEREQRAFADRHAETHAAARERLDRMLAERAPGMTRAGTREIALPAPPPWAQPPPGRRPRRDEAPAPAGRPDAHEEPPPGTAEAAEVAPHAPPGRPEEPRRPAPQPGAARPAAGPRGVRPQRPEPHAAVARPPAVGAHAGDGLAPGRLVRFRQGPLRGRVGTLFEISPKGEARVMLGLFTTRVPLEHVVEVRRREPPPDRADRD